MKELRGWSARNTGGGNGAGCGCLHSPFQTTSDNKFAVVCTAPYFLSDFISLFLLLTFLIQALKLTQFVII
jgi:hypothetical protein